MNKLITIIIPSLFLLTPALAQEPAPAAEAKPGLLQVQMHVWISETTEQGLRDLGANINYTRFEDNTSDSLQQITTDLFEPNNPLFDVTLPAPGLGSPLRPDRSGSAPGIQTQSGLGVNFTLFKGDHGQIDTIFRGIDQNADVDLISKPEILVLDGHSAKIHAGGKVPYQDIKYVKGAPQLNVVFKDIGVNMDIKPKIKGDGIIEIDLTKLDVTDVTRVDNIRGVDLPVFSTRSQTGIVFVPNGQALVIGGLTSEITRRSERRVPLLGKIPVFGTLFRARQAEVLKTHLMIFVAPTIVDLREMTAQSTDALEFWKQGSWRNEEAIGREIQILKDEL
jgi:type II secretory pathway component GspD/PulD (secretin)